MIRAPLNNLIWILLRLLSQVLKALFRRRHLRKQLGQPRQLDEFDSDNFSMRYDVTSFSRQMTVKISVLAVTIGENMVELVTEPMHRQEHTPEKNEEMNCTKRRCGSSQVGGGGRGRSDANFGTDTYPFNRAFKFLTKCTTRLTWTAESAGSIESYTVYEDFEPYLKLDENYYRYSVASGSVIRAGPPGLPVAPRPSLARMISRTRASHTQMW
ncbi:hypothetical protein PF002_g19518 [Phytophthora fragariae]|uniref:Uncharacterized protein n=1 Tax=Phytophthora fragariae TaxID=53985 RepID=A0A6A3XTN5_9STRA|nr:hypothetical protein PF002_g19518 [Phytophthora fragariae]